MTSIGRLRLGLVATALAAAGACAHAGGLLSGLATKAAEHVAEHQIKKHVEDARPAPVGFPTAGSFAQCVNLFPNGIPLDVSKVNRAWKPVALCSGRYAVLYSMQTKTPLVVIERLTRDQLNDALDESRTDEFFADPRLPAGARAELSDYAGTGYDRGHMAPAADMPDRQAMAQSFVLSNMVPQDPHNNRKVWSKVESDTRKYARRANGDVFVFSGPLFEQEIPPTIGRNRVWVPSSLFKLVYDASTGRAWAHVLGNNAQSRVEAPMDYPSFVRVTNWGLLDGVLSGTQTTKR